MAFSLEWSELDQTRTKEILSATNLEESKTRLANALHMESELEQDSISFMLYHQILLFACHWNFGPNQISTLISFIKKVHETSTSAFLTKDQSFKLLSKLLITHSVQRPPYSVGIFAPSQAERVVNWTVEVYYNHYKLYQAICGKHTILNLSSTAVDDFIEKPPTIESLQNATMEEINPEHSDTNVFPSF